MSGPEARLSRGGERTASPSTQTSRQHTVTPSNLSFPGPIAYPPAPRLSRFCCLPQIRAHPATPVHSPGDKGSSKTLNPPSADNSGCWGDSGKSLKYTFFSKATGSLLLHRNTHTHFAHPPPFKRFYLLTERVCVHGVVRGGEGGRGRGTSRLHAAQGSGREAPSHNPKIMLYAETKSRTLN